MKLYSTNNKDLRVPFEEAVFNALPKDRGLYMPVEIPKINPYFIQHIEQYTLTEIAFEVAHTLIGDSIPKKSLKTIVEEAIDFEAPLNFLTSDTAVLELFHGPSFAFKDFGARFMSRVMGFFSQKEKGLLEVLVATSGDTGGAVALGFLGVEGTRVTILYPKGKVSEVQELQLTTNGKNIRAIEIDGTFDDCQSLVKEAFNDPELSATLNLTSANSINIARLIPQTFYYFYAYAQLKSQGVGEVVFTVPSGNYGNIGAGLLAYKMGLPVHKFVAATNANDTVPRFLSTGAYSPKPSVQTLSNAMDVGDPSNWVRILDLFDNDLDELRSKLISYSFSDEQTLGAIEDLIDQHDYVACPHTAVAYLAAEQFKKDYPGNYASIFLSTAHPCKFPEAFSKEVFEKIKLPDAARDLIGQNKIVTQMEVNYANFKAYLLQK